MVLILPLNSWRCDLCLAAFQAGIKVGKGVEATHQLIGASALWQVVPLVTPKTIGKTEKLANETRWIIYQQIEEALQIDALTR